MSANSRPSPDEGDGVLSDWASGPQRAGDVVSGGGSLPICRIHSRVGGSGTWCRGVHICNVESFTGCPPHGCTAGRSQPSPYRRVRSPSGLQCERVGGMVNGRLMACLSCFPVRTTPSAHTNTPPGYECPLRKRSIG